LNKRVTPGGRIATVAEQTTSTHGVLRPDLAHTRFKLERRPPAEDLADLVERHWTVSWSVPPGAAFTQELLPHPCGNLVTEADFVAVHGMPLRRGAKRLEGAGSATGTKFRPGALTAFTGRAATVFLGASLPLPAVFGEPGHALERELFATAADPRSHIDAVEQFLRAHRPGRDPRFVRLLAVVADMLAGDHGLTVADFARRHGVSLRTLQRLFRDYVGVGPKWVLKRYRVHEAAERLATGEASDGARLAAELGYSDQSHFIREFTAQIGVSPGVYGRACALARAEPDRGPVARRAGVS
jgi:AraC-like DNA-binding protein